MAISSKKDAGTAVVRAAFGAPLAQQGRGFYVTLELLAICWGTPQGQPGTVLPRIEGGEVLRYARRSHDFARRWMADQGLDDDDRLNVRGASAEETLRTLLASLRVPIPHQRRSAPPSWGNQHLYPYIGELVHYDSLDRRGKVSMERNTFRGGGGLAHKILRTDPDEVRLSANRAGLTNLVSEETGPLGRLAKALAHHDQAQVDPDFADRTESEATVFPEDRWVEHLRNGVRNITSRADTPRTKQVELLMHWVPFSIARHQIDRAAIIEGRELPSLPIAVDQNSGALRQAGRRQLDIARSTVQAALRRTAERLAESAVESDRHHLSALLEGGTWSDGPMQFLTGTLAAVGALNAHTGRRHFTLSLPLIEATVHASLAPGESVSFERFCEEILSGELSLVVDPTSGARVRLTDDIDHGELARNAAQLADELKGLGLLDEYSDATRMVHAEVSR